MSKRNTTPEDVIRFLQQLPQDKPIWIDVVTIRDVRDMIANLHSEEVDADSVSDETISRAMVNYERACYFEETPLAAIVDEAVVLHPEGGSK